MIVESDGEKRTQKRRRRGFATRILNAFGTFEPQTRQFFNKVQPTKSKYSGSDKDNFLLLLLVETGLGIIDGQTLNALRLLVESLVESQQFYPNETLLAL